MATRLVKFAVALAVAIMLLVLVVPGFFGVAREAPFAQIVPFRLATGLAAVAAAAVLVVLAVLVAPIRRLSLALAALGVAFALVLAGVQGLRGYGSAPRAPTGSPMSASRAGISCTMACRPRRSWSSHRRTPSTPWPCSKSRARVPRRSRMLSRSRVRR
ncbi:hypothetical protein [Rathayibacter iranicus]|uniref:hypothetical protein n=1 Tax=Rathayibacter iranicus TaxID=59737 RepID=UPI001F4EAFA2|nr:hypothetical protein [Rathayibacter iranicus]